MFHKIKCVYMPLAGSDDMYVCEQGHVFIKIGDFVKQCKSQTNNSGYERIGIYLYDRKQYKLVHRLVAETFIHNPNKKPQVNHIDGNKSNNQVSNLEWVTGKENMQHASKHGLVRKSKKVFAIS